MNQSGENLESRAAKDPSVFNTHGEGPPIAKTDGLFAALLESKLIVIWLMATLEININLIPGGEEDETRASTGSWDTFYSS